MMPFDLKTIEELSGALVQADFPMARVCTLRAGGKASWYTTPANAQAAQALYALLCRLEVPSLILGGGANILIRDEGFPGVVLATTALTAIAPHDSADFWVEAGVTNSALTRFCESQARSGFEWASGLPGTVGGGVFMNARCYEGSFDQMVRAVRVATPEEKILELNAAASGFGYKVSRFQQEPLFILAALLHLPAGNEIAIRAKNKEIFQDRVHKGHFRYPSAGCFFKNDPATNCRAGELIDRCGLKNTRLGGAKVSEFHANFIVNANQATASDLIRLMEKVRQTVLNQHGILLKNEIQIIPRG
jgi:UDP-N-acetylmuramate dehydrogenase